MSARWNTRAQMWALSISDEDDNVIISSVGLRCGINLLSPFNFDIGGLYCSDVTKSGLEPTLDNINSEVYLIYISPDE